MNLVLRFLRGTWRFIIDFFVGDTPELFFAALGILAMTAIVSTALGAHRLAAILLPLGVCCALGISLARAAKRAR